MAPYDQQNRYGNGYIDPNVAMNSPSMIYAVREKLRGTPRFSEIFYTLIGDINRPARFIEATQTGAFRSACWDPARNTYEQMPTMKLNDPQIGYIEGCAIFLLIQECFPNVYEFPPNSVTQLQMGATIKLVMKSGFVGRMLNPALIRQPMANVQQPVPQPQQPQSQSAPGRKFCSNCGAPVSEGMRFCSSCGAKLE